MFVNMRNIAQEQVDGSAFCQRLNNRRVNSIDIVAHELAINGDRDGALARWWSKFVSLRITFHLCKCTLVSISAN